MKTPSNVYKYLLGFSAFYHDSAACLIRCGEVVAAVQEERFSRVKHDPEFPHRAVRNCLAAAGADPSKIGAVVFYDKPILTFDRLILSYLAAAPSGIRSWLRSMPLWLGRKLFVKQLIHKEIGFTGPIFFTEHHEAHAAAAFFPSPFERAAILTVDGVGEWATALYGIGEGNRIQIVKELHFPDSVGLLYSAFTYFTGFKVNSGEYKLMGLAPYGRPIYRDRILDELVDVKEDGSIRLNLDYFDFIGGLRMTNQRFADLFDGPARKPESPITRREMDLAASIQSVTESIILRMARHVKKKTGEKNLCLAGGVALNCVANGRLLRDRIFEDIWIQPAAGDAGGALGAALSVCHHVYGVPRKRTNGRDGQKGSYLGPAFSNAEIIETLDEYNAQYHQLDPTTRASTIADCIADGKIVGYFAGRMEFGPRALGARSILGDPRRPDTQRVMNLKIKYRESFRPFAPMVLEEKASEYFELDRPSPYMLLVANVRPERRTKPPADPQDDSDILSRVNQIRSDIPAVTHVDYSARVQTINRRDKPDMYDVLAAFEQKTGCAVVVNTSFNVRGEPIVCTPEDAYRCFMRTEMDVLVLEDLILYKEEQPPWKEGEEWRDAIEPD